MQVDNSSLVVFFITNPSGHHPSVLFFQLSQKSNILAHERHILIMIWGESHVKSVHKCLKFPLLHFASSCKCFCSFHNAWLFCPMLTTELIAELTCSESDTAEMLLIWWYVHYVYSECCEAFFINSWEEIIFISSEDLLRFAKQLILKFSVLLPLIFAHSFTALDSF